LNVSGGTGINWFSGNTSSDLVRITQVGTGNAFVVEDNTPESSPFVITSGGSVTIGTTEPFTTGGGEASQLTVSKGSSGVAFSGLLTSTTAVFQSNTTQSIGMFTPDGSNSQIYFGTPSERFGSYLRWDYTNRNLILSTANSTGKLIFQTANSVEVARINQSGNMGLGTNNPSERLDVSGKTKTINFQMTSGATAGYVLTSFDGDGNARWSPIGSTSSSELDPVISILSTPPGTPSIGDRYLISGGTGTWVGKSNQIAEYTGGSTPNWSYTIPVTDNVVFVTNTLTTYLYNGTSWIQWQGTAILQNGNTLGSAINIGSNDNRNLTFRTSGQTRITISGSDGNVGIGTTSPSSRLHVVATASTNTEEIARFSVSDDTSYLRIINGTFSNGQFVPTINGYNSTNRPALIFIATGATDTGSEALMSFDVRLTGGTAVNNRTVFTWNNNFVSQMLMSASGNLGIGTTNPTARLTVSGGTNSGVARIGEVRSGYVGITLNSSSAETNYNIISSSADTTLYINRPSTKDIRFRENDVDQVTIQGTTGNVGIGTSTMQHM